MVGDRIAWLLRLEKISDCGSAAEPLMLGIGTDSTVLSRLRITVEARTGLLNPGQLEEGLALAACRDRMKLFRNQFKVYARTKARLGMIGLTCMNLWLFHLARGSMTKSSEGNGELQASQLCSGA
jgi:hypothetical protein